jgi:tRNA 2-selenouridine synthase
MRVLFRFRTVPGGAQVPLIVAIGLAGAGKTAILRELASRGRHVVDLERLARHSGSAFGGFGPEPQPSQAEFDESLAAALACGGAGRPTWIEDEGPFLGSLSLPPDLLARLAVADAVEVVAPRAARIDRLVATYGSIDPRLLIKATQRIRPRLGAARADRAIRAFGQADVRAGVDALLPYFDEAYRFRAARCPRRIRQRVEFSGCGAAGSGVGDVAALVADRAWFDERETPTEANR